MKEAGPGPGSPGNRVILITNWHLRIGGVERKIVDLARYLSESPEYAGCRVYLILDEAPPRDPGETFFYEAVQRSSVRVVWKTFFGSPWSAFPFSLFLLWKILVLKPEAILSFLRRLAIISTIAGRILFWRRMRILISDDTMTSMSLDFETKSPVKKYVTFQLIRRCYRMAHRIVSPSGNSKRDLMETFGIREDMIVVNPNWVSEIPEGVAAEKQYDAIYVGRVDPEKNIELFVEIMEEAASRIPSFRACIVGGGKGLRDVERLLGRSRYRRHVELAGVQRDVGRFLRTAKVFCLTSRYEGFPIAALEAMAYGLPVITTAYPGAEELVRNGETGYACGSREEYVDRLVALIRNEAERTEMGNRARERVRLAHGEKNLESLVNLMLGGTAS